MLIVGKLYRLMNNNHNWHYGTYPKHESGIQTLFPFIAIIKIRNQIRMEIPACLLYLGYNKENDLNMFVYKTSCVGMQDVDYIKNVFLKDWNMI